MKMIRFRIQNYKSIVDSGNCYITNPLTIFAGQNESGKTSILEALEDFSYEKDIRQSATPISKTPKSPEIEVEFELDTEMSELNNKFKLIGNKITIIKKNNDYEILEFKQQVYNKQCIIINSTLKILGLILKGGGKIDEIDSKLKNVISYFESTLSNPEIDIISKSNYNESEFLDIVNFLKKPENMDELNSSYAETLTICNSDLKSTLDLYSSAKEFLLKLLPNFIYFDISQDKIPNSVPFNEIKTNSFINDLAKISNLDIELIQSKDYSNIMGHKKRVNIDINKEYHEFWTQEVSNLEIDAIDQKLFFWINQNELYYMPEQRSKGRQWHLSFYVKITANAIDGKNNILLIDEPGLYLHAKAQKDILKKLVKESSRMLILFTTHSPYLIDPNYLNRIQLVVKDKIKGTQISKIQATAEKDTLTPILTAIGEDVFAGIHTIDRKNSFIVEGISDYYYLNAFKKLIKNTKECYFIPGCGDNIPAIGSVFFGWGLNPNFILDSDKPKLINKLVTKLDINLNNIIEISSDKDKTIEEIFYIPDFKKFILCDENVTISNIKEHIIKTKLNKVLLAKTFFEKVDKGEIKFSDLNLLTQNNIQSIFAKIDILIKEEKNE